MKFQNGTKVIVKDPVWLDEERSGFVAKQLSEHRFLVRLELPFTRTNPGKGWIEVDRQFADQVVREVFSAKQMKIFIREALDNWDFDAIEDGTGPKQQKALEDLEHNALNTFKDGFEVPQGFGDAFDWLAEWAASTAADM